MGIGLQLQEDMRFQRRSWRVQRVGWGVMVLFLAAGLAGVFGGGPLSDARAGTSRALSVRYERLVRRGIPSELVVTFTPRHVVSRLSIETRYLEQAGIEQIWPRPSAVEALGDRTVFSFLTPEAGGPPAVVVFTLESGSMGSLSARLEMENLPPVRVRHFVYP
jgi:hypothetical protein